VATDGAASWALNKDTAKWLAVFERKVLRRIFWGNLINGNVRKEHNKELMQLFGDLDTLSLVVASRCADCAILAHLTVRARLLNLYFFLFRHIAYFLNAGVTAKSGVT
jgi:hypothetical protein